MYCFVIRSVGDSNEGPRSNCSNEIGLGQTPFSLLSLPNFNNISEPIIIIVSLLSGERPRPSLDQFRLTHYCHFKAETRPRTPRIKRPGGSSAAETMAEFPVHDAEFPVHDAVWPPLDFDEDEWMPAGAAHRKSFGSPRNVFKNSHMTVAVTDEMEGAFKLPNSGGDQSAINSTSESPPTGGLNGSASIGGIPKKGNIQSLIAMFEKSSTPKSAVIDRIKQNRRPQVAPFAVKENRQPEDVPSSVPKGTKGEDMRDSAEPEAREEEAVETEFHLTDDEDLVQEGKLAKADSFSDLAATHDVESIFIEKRANSLLEDGDGADSDRARSAPKLFVDTDLAVDTPKLLQSASPKLMGIMSPKTTRTGEQGDKKVSFNQFQEVRYFVEEIRERMNSTESGESSTASSTSTQKHSAEAACAIGISVDEMLNEVYRLYKAVRDQDVIEAEAMKTQFLNWLEMEGETMEQATKRRKAARKKPVVTESDATNDNEMIDMVIEEKEWEVEEEEDKDMGKQEESPSTMASF